MHSIGARRVSFSWFLLLGKQKKGLALQCETAARNDSRPASNATLSAIENRQPQIPNARHKKAAGTTDGFFDDALSA